MLLLPCAGPRYKLSQPWVGWAGTTCCVVSATVRLDAKLLVPMSQGEPRGSDPPAGVGASCATMKPAVAHWVLDGPMHHLGARA